MKKRLLAVVLAVLMVLSLMPTMVFAETEEYEAVVIHKNGNPDTPVAKFDDAFKPANAQDGDTVKLQKNCTSGGMITLGGIGPSATVSSVIVDLNGFTINGSHDDMFKAPGGCDFTFVDSSCNKGQVIPTDGNGIFFAKGGTVTVRGGAYTYDTVGGNFAFCQSNGTVVIEGGIFDFDPSNCTDWTGTNNFVATGYKVIDNDDAATATAYPYKVVSNDYVSAVAAITRDTVTTKYATVETAIGSAEDGDTIDLLKDVTEAGEGYPYITFGYVLVDNSDQSYPTPSSVGKLGSFTIDGHEHNVACGISDINTSLKEELVPYDDTMVNLTIRNCNVQVADGFALQHSVDDTTMTVESGTYTTTGEFGNAVLTSAGTTTIKNGTFNATMAAVMSYGGVTNTENGTFTAATTAIYDGTFTGATAVQAGMGGVVEITGGKFKGALSDGSEYVDIYGEEMKGTISIIGGIFSVDPTAYVVDGYEVITNPDAATVDEYPYAVVRASATPVAKIGDVEYASLAEAIANTPDNVETEIDIIADIEYDTFDQGSYKNAAVVVPSAKNIVLDLNGHTISAVSDVNGATEIIYNMGTLKIVDSEDDGKITYKSNHPDGSYGYGTNTILNRGILTVAGGTIENTTVYGASYAVDSQTYWFDDIIPIEFYLIGGNVVCTTGDAAIRQAATLGEKYTKNGQIVKNNMTISGGKVTGDIWVQSLEAGGTGSYSTLTINGGEITGKVYDTLKGDGSHLVYSVVGGCIGQIGRDNGTMSKEGFVSGGYFRNEVPAARLANGCECVKIAEMANPTADDTAAFDAGYIYTIGEVASDVEVIEVDEEVVVSGATASDGTTIPEEKKEAVTEAAAEAVEALTGNTEVAKAETKVAKAVKTEVSDIIARAVEQANKKDPGSGDVFTGDNDVKTDTKIEVKLETVKVDAQTVATATAVADIKVDTAVYDVKPIAKVTTTITTETGTETKTETVVLTNEDLNGNAVTVRLAVAPTTATLAKVTHRSKGYKDEVFYAPIEGTAPNQYVEIQMTHFSEVEVETLTSTINHLMGHQDKAGEPGVGRAIIPLTAEELAAIGDKLVVVYGEGESAVEFDVDCAYTYFYDANMGQITAEQAGFAAFVIIENHGNDAPISGYGHYKLYSKTGNSEKVFLFDANFTKPAN